MPSDIDGDDPPVTHAIADGWTHFSETMMRAIGGPECLPQAHVAFYLGRCMCFSS